MRHRSVLCLSAAWICAGLAAPALAGHSLSKIAIAGDAAPGTGGGTHANTFLSVALNDLGEVGFVNNVDNGSVAWGAFRSGPTGSGAVSVAGDAAPDTDGGTYFFPGGFTTLDNSGDLSFAAIVTGGSANSGVFADPGGDDVSIVVSGQPAPGTGTGSFAGSITALNGHTANATGTVVFADDVTGGSATAGVFTSADGSFDFVALEGGSAPGTGGTYTAFQNPAINDGADVVFVADVSGGTAISGLFFSPAGGADAAIALEGDAAPGTGGGSFTSFLFPRVNASGVVTFLANVAGGAATGGVFAYDGVGLVAIAVDGGPATGTGGTFATVTSFAPVSDAGRVAFSGTIAGGSVSAAIFLYDLATAGLEPIVTSATPPPGAGGATFDLFGIVDVNEVDDVAFQAELSDENLGLFLASEPAAVPTLGSVGGLLVVIALGGIGWVGSRRWAHGG